MRYLAPGERLSPAEVRAELTEHARLCRHRRRRRRRQPGVAPDGRVPARWPRSSTAGWPAACPSPAPACPASCWPATGSGPKGTCSTPRLASARRAAELGARAGCRRPRDVAAGATIGDDDDRPRSATAMSAADVERFERERRRLEAVGLPDARLDGRRRGRRPGRLAAVGPARPDGRAEVANPAAWCTTVVARLALDRLRAAKRQREDYVGPWLPEPVAATPTRPTSRRAGRVADARVPGDARAARSGRAGRVPARRRVRRAVHAHRRGRRAQRGRLPAGGVAGAAGGCAASGAARPAGQRRPPARGVPRRVRHG